MEGGPDGGHGRSGRGRGGRGRGGRGRSDGSGGRGGRAPRRPDPTPCPLGVDEEGRLKIKITCMIMRDFAGAVIGRGGEHVTDIRKESGALVHVCKADFETGIQGVDLYGTLDQVTSAQAKLASILNAHAGEWCHDKNWGARVRLQLLPDVASVVIGKKGSTVQRISKDSGAVVRVGNDVDSHNLQLCQIFGNNDEAAAAVVLLMDSLREYDAGSSRSIPRLKDQWETRRQAEMYPPPDGGYPGGAGGPSPSRDRYGSSGGGSRYEPYPRRGPSNSGGPDPYNGPSGHGGPPMHGGDAIAPSPMVVMPGGMQAPNIPGQMPTVLIQQADGTLVQAQVVTQAGGQYAVQPATSAQAAVQVLKNGYGISQQLALPTNAGAGGAVPAQAPAPQSGMPGAPHGQVLVQGPNGMMYAATPGAPGAAVASGGQGSGGPDRGGAAPGAPQYGVAPPAAQYQVQPAGAHVGGAGQQQVADPMAYNKLAGYGQQGAAKAPSSSHYGNQAPQQQQQQQQHQPPQQQQQQQQQQMYGAQPGAAYGHNVAYGGAPMAGGGAQYAAQYPPPSSGQYK